MPSLSAPLRLALKVLFSAGLFAALAAFLDFAAFAERLKGIDWRPVALAMLINAGLQVLNAWKVRLLFPAPAPSLGGLVRVNCVANFFNTFVPGGVGGEVARWAYLGEASGSRSRTLAVILVDRITGLWAQILLTLAAVLYMVRDGGLLYAAMPLSVLVVAAGLWAGLAGYRALARALERLGAFIARRRGLAPSASQGIAEALSDLFADRGRFLLILALSLLYQGGIVAAFLALDRSLGDALPWEIAVVLLLGHTLVTLLPITLGTWGLSEGSLGLLYRQAGSPSEAGVLVALLMRVMQLPVALAGWLFWLRGRGEGRA
jgi:uncharacterized protein (TIRG00374 family)